MMEKTPHEANKGATKVSPLPCLVMIILSPLILVYLILSLLFVPIDFLIFKTSRHHRDFGGKYGFLSGAHPDNRLYSFIKKRKIKISYVAIPKDKSFVGYFFAKDTLIENRKNIFWDAEKKEWRIHGELSGGCESYSLAEAEGVRAADFKSAVGRDVLGAIFLLDEKKARKSGEDAYAVASNDERILLYSKKTLDQALKSLEN